MQNLIFPLLFLVLLRPPSSSSSVQCPPNLTEEIARENPMGLSDPNITQMYLCPSYNFTYNQLQLFANHAGEKFPHSLSRIVPLCVLSEDIEVVGRYGGLARFKGVIKFLEDAEGTTALNAGLTHRLEVRPRSNNEMTVEIRQVHFKKAYRPAPPGHNRDWNERMFAPYNHSLHQWMQVRITFKEDVEGVIVQAMEGLLGVPFGEFNYETPCNAEEDNDDGGTQKRPDPTAISTVPCKYRPRSSFRHPHILVVGGRQDEGSNLDTKYNQISFLFNWINNFCQENLFFHFIVVAVRDAGSSISTVYRSPTYYIPQPSSFDGIPTYLYPHLQDRLDWALSCPIYNGRRERDTCSHYVDKANYSSIVNDGSMKIGCSDELFVIYSRVYDDCILGREETLNPDSGRPVGPAKNDFEEKTCPPGPFLCGEKESFPKDEKDWFGWRMGMIEKYRKCNYVKDGNPDRITFIFPATKAPTTTTTTTTTPKPSTTTGSSNTTRSSNTTGSSNTTEITTTTEYITSTESITTTPGLTTTTEPPTTQTYNITRLDKGCPVTENSEKYHYEPEPFRKPTPDYNRIWRRRKREAGVPAGGSSSSSSDRPILKKPKEELTDEEKAYQEILLKAQLIGQTHYKLNKRIHGFLMIIAFLVINPISNMAARFFKETPAKCCCGIQRWIIFHIFLSNLSLILIWTGTVAVLGNSGAGVVPCDKLPAEQVQELVILCGEHQNSKIHTIAGIVVVASFHLSALFAWTRPPETKLMCISTHSFTGYFCHVGALFAIYTANKSLCLEVKLESGGIFVVSLLIFVLVSFIQLLQDGFFGEKRHLFPVLQGISVREEAPPCHYVKILLFLLNILLHLAMGAGIFMIYLILHFADIDKEISKGPESQYYDKSTNSYTISGVVGNKCILVNSTLLSLFNLDRVEFA